MSFFSTPMRAAIVLAATRPDPIDFMLAIPREDRDRDWLQRQPQRARKSKAQRIARRKGRKG